MKPAKLVLVITLVFGLSLVIAAQRPPQDQPQPSQPQMNQDRLEAAHGALLSGQDRAAEASRLTQAVAAALPGAAANSGPIARKNYVDEHIFGKMERDKIPHAPLAGDEEYLRRVYLDATGLLPTPDQVRSFLADTDANKRDKLIDSLIGTEEFADQWAYHYGELLRTRLAPFHIWTKDWLKVDRPYNEVFADMITPVTKNARGFPTALTFYDPIGYIATRCGLWTDADDYKGLNRLDWIDEITSDIGRVFLGLSMDCFSCHNGAGHADSFNMFLGSRKRTDFWQQAAFFGKMRNVGASDGSARSFYFGSSLFDDLAPGYNTANDGQYYTPAEGRFPRDGKTYEPAFLLTGEKPKPGEDPRKALARIVPTHIQFARAAVNVVWQKLMVVGLVEPYDGFDLNRLDPKNPPPAPWTIQPSNPELLEALAQDFRSNNFSIHRVIKTIMKSNAYQLSATFVGEWKDAYVPYHARRFARVLSGPETVDIMAQATATPFALKQNGEARNYVKELTNPLNVKGGGPDATEGNPIYAFMQAYYQAERAMPPVDKNIASPVQAMMMMTSPVVTKRVRGEGSTRVANLLKADKSDEELVEELFLSSVTRRPTPEEMEVAKRILAKDRKTGAENIQWAMLNSTEFLVNH
jgi:hypothetical protein